MIGRTALGALAATVLLAFGTCAAGAEPPAPPIPIVPAPVQPANIGDLKTDAVGYYDSGAYLTDLQLATAPAIAWIDDRAPQVDRPAVVFDIDETALSNWEVIQANDLDVSSTDRAFTFRRDRAVGGPGISRHSPR